MMTGYRSVTNIKFRIKELTEGYEGRMPEGDWKWDNISGEWNAVIFSTRS